MRRQPETTQVQPRQSSNNRRFRTGVIEAACECCNISSRSRLTALARLRKTLASPVSVSDEPQIKCRGAFDPTRRSKQCFERLYLQGDAASGEFTDLNPVLCRPSQSPTMKRLLLCGPSMRATSSFELPSRGTCGQKRLAQYAQLGRPCKILRACFV